MRYQDRALAQRASRESMLDSIALAFQRCPKLSNLIIECLGQTPSPGLLHKASRSYHDIQTEVVADPEMYLTSMSYCIWDILKPVHDTNRALKSLVMLDRYITSPQDWSMPTTTIFRNLKHLRYDGRTSGFLASITTRATQLQSIGITGTYSDDFGSLQSLFGGCLLQNLRACSLKHMVLRENDLVQFLLRHSSKLQDLRITRPSWLSRVNWRSFANRVRGRLPNLERVKIINLAAFTPPLPNGLSATHSLSAADILQDHAYVLDRGPMEVMDGLWEEYEKMFFPGEYKS